MSNNPFATLMDGVEHDLKSNPPDKFINTENNILENILYITHDKDKFLSAHSRPKYLVFIDPNASDVTQLHAQKLDAAIFDRMQMREACRDNVIFLDSDVDVDIDDVLEPNPVVYLSASFKRSYSIRKANFLSDIVEACQQSIIRQLALLLLVDAECESFESGMELYNIMYQAVSSNDSERIAPIQLMFDLLMQHFVKESKIDQDASAVIPSSTLNALRPLVNGLYDHLCKLNAPTASGLTNKHKLIHPKERCLFCPQRQPLMSLTIWLSRYCIMAQLIIEKSTPRTSTVCGYHYEAGLLGRLLIPSHLHTPQTPNLTVLATQGVFGEFFTEEVPLKSSVEAEQRTIWQLTEQLDNELKNLWTNLLIVSKRYSFVKRLLFQWLRGCIQSNKARCQLANTMLNPSLSQSTANDLADDGFLNNLAAVIVRLTGPLVTSVNDPPLDKIWPVYAADSCAERVILPDLAKETRLTSNTHTADPPPTTSNGIDKNDEYPLLTELFFLAHSVARIGWTSVITRHFETTQQLHQLENQLNPDGTSSMNSSDPQTFYLRRFIRERTSRYLEQSTSLSCPTRLKDQLSFAITTCRLLCKLATLKLAPDPSVTLHGSLCNIPEFVVDNIVELVTFLRRSKDGFLESTELSEISLQPLLEYSILFMRHTRLLVNPHLRARSAELLESLIPQRNDEAWNTSGSGLLSAFNSSFHRREELMIRSPDLLYDPVLSHAVAALLNAFVSIELSPGTGPAGSTADSLIASSPRSDDQQQRQLTHQVSSTSSSSSSPDNDLQDEAHTVTVGFEEKFHYRRPMYACLRYWYGTPLYDIQFQELERDALKHIDDVDPPLFLQFMSLLVNDAIFLLDEAINLLTQLKKKEREREENNGRLRTSDDEGLFAYTGRLARHHIILGLDTISALRRVISICPRLVTHPIMVDRIACMLNYFLSRLVGPKQRDLTVRDKAAYGFKPDVLVMEICGIYELLGRDIESQSSSDTQLNSSSEQANVDDNQTEDASTAVTFRRAIVSDERSFTPDILDQASHVLERVAAPMELRKHFAEAVQLIKTENVARAEDEIDLCDAPDDYLDPIMGHLMQDPVMLPSSGQIVDRKTIYRHLLNDSTDPFNRQPLAMSQVLPQTELRDTIKSWVSELRAKRDLNLS